jgi:hypothetical protein
MVGESNYREKRILYLYLVRVQGLSWSWCTVYGGSWELVTFVGCDSGPGMAGKANGRVRVKGDNLLNSANGRSRGRRGMGGWMMNEGG